MTGSKMVLWYLKLLCTAVQFSLFNKFKLVAVDHGRDFLVILMA